MVTGSTCCGGATGCAGSLYDAETSVEGMPHGNTGTKGGLVFACYHDTDGGSSDVASKGETNFGCAPIVEHDSDYT